MFKYKPWANTLQGDAPDAETINKPSPKPNKVKPKQRKKNVEIFGFKFNGFSELHETFGIFLIFKNISIKYFFYYQSLLNSFFNEKIFIINIFLFILFQ